MRTITAHNIGVALFLLVGFILASCGGHQSDLDLSGIDPKLEIADAEAQYLRRDAEARIAAERNPVETSAEVGLGAVAEAGIRLDSQPAVAGGLQTLALLESTG